MRAGGLYAGVAELGAAELRLPLAPPAGQPPPPQQQQPGAALLPSALLRRKRPAAALQGEHEAAPSGPDKPAPAKPEPPAVTEAATQAVTQAATQTTTQAATSTATPTATPIATPAAESIVSSAMSSAAAGGTAESSAAYWSFDAASDEDTSDEYDPRVPNNYEMLLEQKRVLAERRANQERTARDVEAQDARRRAFEASAKSAALEAVARDPTAAMLASVSEESTGRGRGRALVMPAWMIRQQHAQRPGN
jgi:hypothetical protein